MFKKVIFIFLIILFSLWIYFFININQKDTVEDDKNYKETIISESIEKENKDIIIIDNTDNSIEIAEKIDVEIKLNNNKRAIELFKKKKLEWWYTFNYLKELNFNNISINNDAKYYSNEYFFKENIKTSLDYDNLEWYLYNNWKYNILLNSNSINYLNISWKDIFIDTSYLGNNSRAITVFDWNTAYYYRDISSSWDFLFLEVLDNWDFIFSETMESKQFYLSFGNNFYFIDDLIIFKEIYLNQLIKIRNKLIIKSKNRELELWKEYVIELDLISWERRIIKWNQREILSKYYTWIIYDYLTHIKLLDWNYEWIKISELEELTDSANSMDFHYDDWYYISSWGNYTIDIWVWSYNLKIGEYNMNFFVENGFNAEGLIINIWDFVYDINNFYYALSFKILDNWGILFTRMHQPSGMIHPEHFIYFSKDLWFIEIDDVVDSHNIDNAYPGNKVRVVWNNLIIESAFTFDAWDAEDYVISLDLSNFESKLLNEKEIQDWNYLFK